MKQIVQICKWLLTSTGKGHYGLDQKIIKREVAVGKTAEPKQKVIVTNVLNLTEV